LYIINKLKDINKLIRNADTSAGGWATVRECEPSDIADNDEDDKRIYQAEYRALKSIMEKTKVRRTPDKPPEQRPFPNPAYGSIYTRQMPSCRTSVA